MRRTLGVTLATILVLGVAGEVAAQTDQPYLRLPHRAHIFVDGGIAIPALPSVFKDFWNPTLPLSIGAGGVVFPWLDLNGVFTYVKFNNNFVKTKQSIDYVGIGEVEGGSFTSIMFAATARFLAVPNSRANPYLEFGVGSFTNSFENLIIRDPNNEDQTPIIENTAEDVSGIMVSIAGGLQYALNEQWSSYVKYSFTTNINEDFKPGVLVGEPETAPGGNQRYSSLSIGLMIRL